MAVTDHIMNTTTKMATVIALSHCPQQRYILSSNYLINFKPWKILKQFTETLCMVLSMLTTHKPSNKSPCIAQMVTSQIQVL